MTTTKITEAISAEVSPDGSKMVLTVDLDQTGNLSKTGKSVMHASTNGNVKIPDTDLVIGLNIYSKAK